MTSHERRLHEVSLIDSMLVDLAGAKYSSSRADSAAGAEQ